MGVPTMAARIASPQPAVGDRAICWLDVGWDSVNGAVDGSCDVSWDSFWVFWLLGLGDTVPQGGCWQVGLGVGEGLLGEGVGEFGVRFCWFWCNSGAWAVASWETTLPRKMLLITAIAPRRRVRDFKVNGTKFYGLLGCTSIVNSPAKWRVKSIIRKLYKKLKNGLECVKEL